MDITQFHATFFEEAKDCLDAMESGLLALESGEADAETINTIFRSAHSIKGGAGTFGFQGVANFTHVLETLLDAMRSGRSPISPQAVATLLGATDVLRSLLHAAEHGGDFDAQALRSSESDLAALMQVDASSAPQKEDVVEKLIAGWQIGFKPAASMFMTGNDPLRILRELERLGPLQATCNADTLPSLNDLDPFEAHLAWDLRLEAPAARDAVDEAFAWVLDECDLSIQEIQPPAATVQEETAAASASAAAPPAFGRRAEDNPTEGSIRVSISKIDALINLVGELVITQAMLKQLSDDLDPAQYEKLLNGMSHLDRNTRDMQDAVMNVRMLPMDSVFSRFPRVVRDISGKLNKLVRMKTVGEATELDKGVIEKIVDPLNHLVRNAVDHGLELPDVRRKAGKDETGTVTLRAMHQGGHVVIEVSDDGKGLDRGKILKKASDHGLSVSDSMTDSEVWQLVFHPGLSTADSVTDVSGRGVGMDVVKKNINSLGGQVEIASTPGAGSTVTIRLPLTLAILDGMSVSVGDEIFILPLASVLESLQPRLEDLKSVAGGGQLVYVRGEYVPMLLLHEVFGIADARTEPHEAILVLVESENKKLALMVDELVGQQQVVIKNLESNYKRVRGVSGATILGDGRVALIIDVGGLPKVMGATTDRKVVAREQ